ncbi:LamB/YcsF family protein [Calidifontibacter sp. DB0510]|uniref:5-oxoprolinase subunit A n=1 Tax=Metallococcus carri TaxID=1656884 RepID=A0A967B3C3_9MICO|nr:LamB/YcsF family protein [Metallococcus carri]NOP37850.1 LamB/YcsF family protein [Calidifontibacter sp. DB2511S]
MLAVDLNADVGESFGPWALGDDQALMPLITSANVACGFHAGDPATLVRTCRAAVEHGVIIGAAVGYRDLAGFGRRFLDVSPEDLYADVLYQLGALAGLARVAGSVLRYVKPHGALASAVVDHEVQASAIVTAIRDFDRELAVLGQGGSMLHELAEEAGLRTVREGFADRGYLPSGRLVPRGDAGSVLQDPDQIAARAVRLATEGTIVAVTGDLVDLTIDSICLHSDSPSVVAVARQVRTLLDAEGVPVAPFAS